jgi:hypothetical protein
MAIKFSTKDQSAVPAAASKPAKPSAPAKAAAPADTANDLFKSPAEAPKGKAGKKK